MHGSDGEYDRTAQCSWELRPDRHELLGTEDHNEGDASVPGFAGIQGCDRSRHESGLRACDVLKPDVILTPDYEYGVFMSLGEALGIPVVRFDL